MNREFTDEELNEIFDGWMDDDDIAELEYEREWYRTHGESEESDSDDEFIQGLITMHGRRAENKRMSV